MSNLAINDKGEALAFDGKDWKPAPVAVNDKGEKVAFDGADWRPIDAKRPEGNQTAAKIKATAGDVADKVNTGINWAGTQFTKGVTGLLGAPAALGELGNQGAAYLGEKVGAPETGKQIGGAFKQQMTFGGLAPSTEGMNKFVFGDMGVPEVNAGDNPALTLTNPFGFDGKVNLGKMADAGMQAIPGMMALPAGPAAQALSPGARAATTAIPAFAGGATSEAAGQATEGTPYEIPARIAGGAFGALAGNRMVSPLPANLTPQQLENVEAARRMNIPMTVGQETGRGRRVESVVGRFPTSEGRMAAFGDQQRQAINRTTLQTTGTAGDRVDPQTINAGFDRLGAEFTRLTQGRPVELRPDFFTRVGRAVQNYTDDVLPSDVSPAVMRRWNDLQNIQPGAGQTVPTITSSQYQEFRRSISTAAAKQTDPAVRGTLRDMREALDDAMQASLPPAEAMAWRTARTQYGNLKTISKAAAAGTQESRSAGNLSPGALTSAVRQSRGVDQFSRGQTPLNDVARVGDYLADTRPNSGTPERLAMQATITGAPITAGYAVGGVPGALAATAGMALPNVMARAMTGTGGLGWLRNYLANQAAPTANPQLYGPGSLPYSLAPGLAVSAPRLENRK